VAELVTKSLVVVEADSTVARYRLLDTTRTYALEKLAESGEHDRLVRRLAEYYGDLFERAEIDIHGDGVNVAAGLEAISEPGGICISGTVRDHIGDRLDLVFDDLGEQALKNIARPVRPSVRRDALAPGSRRSDPILLHTGTGGCRLR
jgi:adenylate cyclase